MIAAVVNVREKDTGEVVTQIVVTEEEMSMPGYLDTTLRQYDHSDWTTETITVLEQSA